MKQETKNCQNCKSKFIIESEDLVFYQKMDVPLPTLCPDCRYQRRLINRNEWNLYKRKCDFTSEDIISIYRPEVPFPVYKHDAWWSDKWNPLDYGRDFDFTRPFFEQFRELRDTVPHLAIVNSNSINSDYTNQSQNNKDCYMCAASGDSEKCMYGNWYQLGCLWSVDCYAMEKCELCYESLNCAKCYSCAYVQDCHNCISLYFSIDCRNCNDCFGCAGLRNKKYCMFNEQLSKDNYEKRFNNFIWTRDFISEMQYKAYKFSLKLPRKFYHGRKNINATGDYLENTANISLSFNCRHSKDVAYLQDSWKMQDCLDMTEILEAQLSYETQGCFQINKCISLRSCWTASDAYYCDLCFYSDNLFGCISLHNKKYCILNKQYSKQEYENLKTKIIEHMKKTGEWGEYYPAEITPFTYNESIAQEYFPINKEDVLKMGLKWHTGDTRDYKATMQWNELPKTIDQVTDDILKETISCESQKSEQESEKHPICTTAFRIVELELAFYRKMNLPLPQKCFPCRRQERFSLRNPRRLWHRQCMCDYKIYKNTDKHKHHLKGKCPNEFETTYSPKRKEIVYCKACYQQEIV